MDVNEIQKRITHKLEGHVGSSAGAIAEVIIAAIAHTELTDLDLTVKTEVLASKEKLVDIEDGATADQTGVEIQGAIMGLSEGIRTIVPSVVGGGTKKIINIYTEGDSLVVVSEE